MLYLIAGDCAQSPDEDEPTWLGRNIVAFHNAVNEYTGGSQ